MGAGFFYNMFYGAMNRNVCKKLLDIIRYVFLIFFKRRLFTYELRAKC